MKEVKKKIEVGYSQGKLKERFLRLFRAEVDSRTHLVGQIEPHRDSPEKIRSITLGADHAKATALIEWQKSRRIPQAL